MGAANGRLTFTFSLRDRCQKGRETGVYTGTLPSEAFQSPSQRKPDIEKWSGNFRVIFVGTKIEEYVSEFSSFQWSELKHLNFQQKIQIFVCRTLYNQLSHSGQLAITDTPLLRIAAEVP